MKNVLEYLKNDSEIKKYCFFQDDKFFGNKVIGVRFLSFYLCFIDDRGYYSCYICSHENINEAYDLNEICTLVKVPNVSYDSSLLEFIQKSLSVVKENIDCINKLFEKVDNNQTFISTKIKSTVSVEEIMLVTTKLYKERKSTFQFFEN